MCAYYSTFLFKVIWDHLLFSPHRYTAELIPAHRRGFAWAVARLILFFPSQHWYKPVCSPALSASECSFMDEKLLKPKPEKSVLGIRGKRTQNPAPKNLQVFSNFSFLLATYQSSLLAPAHEQVCTSRINENTFKNAHYPWPINCEGHAPHSTCSSLQQPWPLPALAEPALSA